MGFPRQEYWTGLPFPSPGDLPHPGIELWSPAGQVDSLPLHHLGSPLQVLVAGLKAQIYSNLTISLHVESLCVQADRSGSSSSLTSERVTGRKAVGLQMGEIGFKCQAFFLSLLRARRKQTTSVLFFPFSIQNYKEVSFYNLCCHDNTWFHQNVTFLKP